MKRTLAVLKEHHVTGLAKWTDQDRGPLESSRGESVLLATWVDLKAGKGLDKFREMVKSKRIVAFAELQEQYQGTAVSDPAMEPYYALAVNWTYLLVFTWVQDLQTLLTSPPRITASGFHLY
jgi:hypothetical protein